MIAQMLELKTKILSEYWKVNEMLKFLKVIIRHFLLVEVIEIETLKEFFIVK
jgi:hypothetical protein